jgi:DNA polymerase III alpha subunit
MLEEKIIKEHLQANSSARKDAKKYAIRFGLGAIKAVGFNMMEKAADERKENGKFTSIYDFAERLNPRSINKKSIEALAKAGAFDEIHENRCQIAESYEILTAYSNQKSEEKNSNQMSLFGGIPEANIKPDLKKVSNWDKNNRLQKEFEAFGFFLNEHPLDDKLTSLKKRGIVFSTKIEKDEFIDGNLVKMAGVVASSKHRSGSRGRFAYVNISDPFGIYEVLIFDESLINSSRDLLNDGSQIFLDCLVRRDEGGIRILVNDLKSLNDFINSTPESTKEFEDIKVKKFRKFNKDFNKDNNSQNGEKNDQGNNWKNNQNSNLNSNNASENKQINPADIYEKVEIEIKDQNAIFSLKAFLSTCLAKDEQEKASEVYIKISQTNQGKILLPKKYIFTNQEISKAKKIQNIINIIYN